MFILFQIICDAELMIRDIECRWPGSTHDSFMLNMSEIATRSVLNLIFVFSVCIENDHYALVHINNFFDNI